uniref:Uncharacterized protein n=1 Tax=viral metagenome TaxID=1070528 RepID=A0A6C0DF24_9ZZZZ
MVQKGGQTPPANSEGGIFGAFTKAFTAAADVFNPQQTTTRPINTNILMNTTTLSSPRPSAAALLNSAPPAKNPLSSLKPAEGGGKRKKTMRKDKRKNKRNALKKRTYRR